MAQRTIAVSRSEQANRPSDWSAPVGAAPIKARHLNPRLETSSPLDPTRAKPRERFSLLGLPAMFAGFLGFTFHRTRPEGVEEDLGLLS